MPPLRFIDGALRSNFLAPVLGSSISRAVVSSISPSFGAVAGDVVPRVISGSHFTGTTSVIVGGAAATFTVVDDSTILVTSTPALVAGLQPVTVGGTTLANAYTAIDISAWYRGDLLITQPVAGDGLVVSAWGSAISDGDANKTASNGTNATRPVLHAVDANFNSKPTVAFSRAANTRLVSGAWSSIVGNPRTSYFVARQATNAIDVVIDGIDSTHRSMFYSQSGAIQYAGAQINSGVAFGATTRIVCGVFDGVSSAIYVDRYGVADATGNTGSQTRSGITIGNQYSFVNPWDGEVAEILICPGSHNLATRTMIATYLAGRYGKSVGP